MSNAGLSTPAIAGQFIVNQSIQLDTPEIAEKFQLFKLPNSVKC